MKTAAVIAEYNPFHNGHLYQLQSIREEYSADYIVVVMSGNFMQRGIPAIVDKYDRCRMALENGADLVLELPVYFSLGSAEYFACGAVSLLDKLGIVDLLHFGSECGSLNALAACAATLSNETEAYKKALHTALKEGKPFPAARAAAMNTTDTDILSTPNNILGIEYIKALLARNSSITPVTICRNGSAYNASVLENETFASANAIRRLLQNMQASTQQLSQLRDFVPDSVYKYLQSVCEKPRPFVFINDFSQLLHYKLLQELQATSKGLAMYYDVTQPLANTFCKKLQHFATFSQYALDCKSKNITYSRISRCLMHILLDMKQETIDALKASDYCQYARLLGFNTQGYNLLKHIKANASIPIISNLPRALKSLDGISLASLKADIYASDIYHSVKSAHTAFPTEVTRKIIKIL